MNKFTENYNKDLNGLIEEIPVFGGKKLKYLSWAHVIKFMNENYDNFYYNFELSNKLEGYVLISISYNEIEKIEKTYKSYQFPILNNKHKAIPYNEITQWDINNSVMRGLVKAVAIYTGYGLRLYTGEDLHQYNTQSTIDAQQEIKRKTRTNASQLKKHLIETGKMDVFEEKMKKRGIDWEKLNIKVAEEIVNEIKDEAKEKENE